MRDGGSEVSEETAPTWRTGLVPVDAAEARRRVKALLGAALGRPSASAQDAVVTDALLVTSELVTNALRHAGGVTAFEAMADRVGLRLVVEDASPGLPSTKEPGGDFTPGGYGWPMICRLATSVTVSLLPAGGKRIQVFLPL
ncbi:hypothetical protein A8W25_00705 [Streptomyces sp. ERV7]|nr:hypothetical protein A8W25_00705 [Streptomyces sp. ERV7]